jgi:hypothetical protein
VTDGLLILSNNFMTDGGKHYAACSAVFAGYVFDTHITSNTITDFSCVPPHLAFCVCYNCSFVFLTFHLRFSCADSSISVGWGWGSSKFLGYGNNNVSYNRMRRIMTKLRDGGGVYVNGWTNPAYRNTVLLSSRLLSLPCNDPLQMSHNWCDADEAVFAVYYLDNGSSRWDVFQNVGSNSSLPWCYFMTGGGGPTGKASNSSVSALWCQDTSPGRNDCVDQGCTVDESSVLYVVTACPAKVDLFMLMAISAVTSNLMSDCPSLLRPLSIPAAARCLCASHEIFDISYVESMLVCSLN